MKGMKGLCACGLVGCVCVGGGEGVCPCKGGEGFSVNPAFFFPLSFSSITYARWCSTSLVHCPSSIVLTSFLGLGVTHSHLELGNSTRVIVFFSFVVTCKQRRFHPISLSLLSFLFCLVIPSLSCTLAALSFLSSSSLLLSSSSLLLSPLSLFSLQDDGYIFIQPSSLSFRHLISENYNLPSTVTSNINSPLPHNNKPYRQSTTPTLPHYPFHTPPKLSPSTRQGPPYQKTLLARPLAPPSPSSAAPAPRSILAAAALPGDNWRPGFVDLCGGMFGGGRWVGGRDRR